MEFIKHKDLLSSLRDYYPDSEKQIETRGVLYCLLYPSKISGGIDRHVIPTARQFDLSVSTPRSEIMELKYFVNPDSGFGIRIRIFRIRDSRNISIP